MEEDLREQERVMMGEVRQIWRDEAVNGFEGVQEEFELCALLDRKPVEVLQDGGDMVV